MRLGLLFVVLIGAAAAGALAGAPGPERIREAIQAGGPAGPIAFVALYVLVAGLTGVRVGAYVPATVLGTIPASLVYSAVGGESTRPDSPAFIAAVAGLAALLGGGALLARRLRLR